MIKIDYEVLRAEIKESVFNDARILHPHMRVGTKKFEHHIQPKFRMVDRQIEIYKMTKV